MPYRDVHFVPMLGSRASRAAAQGRGSPGRVPQRLYYPKVSLDAGFGCESVGRVPKQRRAYVGLGGDVSQGPETAKRKISCEEGYWIWQSARVAVDWGLGLDVGACGD